MQLDISNFQRRSPQPIRFLHNSLHAQSLTINSKWINCQLELLYEQRLHFLLGLIR